MSIEYIRFRIPEIDRLNFIQAISKASAIMLAYADCLNSTTAQCEEYPELFIWRIEWTSTDAHLNGFRKDKLFTPFYSLMEPYIKSIEEMNHYTLV